LAGSHNAVTLPCHHVWLSRTVWHHNVDTILASLFPIEHPATDRPVSHLSALSISKPRKYVEVNGMGVVRGRVRRRRSPPAGFLSDNVRLGIPFFLCFFFLL